MTSSELSKKILDTEKIIIGLSAKESSSHKDELEKLVNITKYKEELGQLKEQKIVHIEKTIDSLNILKDRFEYRLYEDTYEDAEQLFYLEEAMEQLTEYESKFSEKEDFLLDSFDSDNYLKSLESGEMPKDNSDDKAQHRLFVDMDGTLAEFKYVNYQEQLFEEGYYANLRPHKNVLEAVRSLINNSDIEVFILSAYLTDSKYALNEKNEWLDKYLPEIKNNHRIFVPCGTDKKAAISNLTDKDFLLDDYTVNLLDWTPPGKGIKLINNLNHTKGTWKEDCLRFERSSDDIACLINNVITGKTRIYDTKVNYDSQHPVLKSPNNSLEITQDMSDFINNSSNDEISVHRRSRR